MFKIANHILKQKFILIQLLELLLIPIDIICYIYNSYSTGRSKYWFGNFTVELRRRYNAIYVYPWSIRNYLLHRLGVTLMDPFGRFFKNHFIKHEYISPKGALQYLHTLNPIFYFTVRRYLISKKCFSK